VTVTLRLRQPPPLRLDLRALSPLAQAAMPAADIERLAVGHGTQMLPLAEFFDVLAGSDDAPGLRLQGDLSRCDRIGWQLAAGQLDVEGAAGHHAGAAMTGGALVVHGSTGDLAACEMAGGTLTVHGSVGDFAAAPLPGSMEGMRGGTLVVHGHAGQRLADRMRRGTVLVHGDAGDFLASRLVAGTIAIGGRCGAHPAYGMRRGSLLFLAAEPDMQPAIPPTFVPAVAPADVFWQLLARSLQRHGGPCTALAARRITRHLGDVAAAGKGELIVVAPAC